MDTIRFEVDRDIIVMETLDDGQRKSFLEHIENGTIFKAELRTDGILKTDRNRIVDIYFAEGSVAYSVPRCWFKIIKK